MANHGERRITRQEQRPSEREADASSRGSSLIQQRTEVSFSGPVPAPATLDDYEKIVPGSAERIFAMAEKQLEHRMHLEKVVVEGGSKRADK